MRDLPTQTGPGGTALRLGLAIATAGRPACLMRLLARIGAQSRAPDGIFVCGPGEADVAGLAEGFPGLRLVTGRRGLPSQRNALLAALEGYDVAVFLDDDFVPARGYLAAVEAAMLADPSVVMTTGHVLADGIRGAAENCDMLEFYQQCRPVNRGWDQYSGIRYFVRLPFNFHYS